MRWLWFLLGFIVLFPNVLAAGLVVSTEDISGPPGEVVQILINLEGASKVGSMDIILNFDPLVLNPVEVENGPLGESAFMEANIENDGEVIIAFADSSGISGDGTIAIFSAEVVGEIDETTELNLDALAYDADTLVDIITSTDSGIFTVMEDASGSSIKGIITVIILVILIIGAGLILKGKMK